MPTSAIMSAPADLYSQALALPPASREELAMLLLESLPEGDDAPFGVSEEWEQEIARRLAEREAGTAQAVDLAAFTATVHAAARRGQA
jgi:putative addiction module component (TIGR02574 family)